MILATIFSELWDIILNHFKKFSTLWNEKVAQLSVFWHWENTSKQFINFFVTFRQKFESRRNFFYNWVKIVVNLTNTSTPLEKIVILVAEFLALRHKTLVQLTNVLTQLDKLVILGKNFPEMWDKTVSHLTNFSTPWYKNVFHPSNFLTLWHNILRKLTKILSFSDKIVNLDSTFSKLGQKCGAPHTFFDTVRHESDCRRNNYGTVTQLLDSIYKKFQFARQICDSHHEIFSTLN